MQTEIIKHKSQKIGISLNIVVLLQYRMEEKQRPSREDVDQDPYTAMTTTTGIINKEK